MINQGNISVWRLVMYSEKSIMRLIVDFNSRRFQFPLAIGQFNIRVYFLNNYFKLAHQTVIQYKFTEITDSTRRSFRNDWAHCDYTLTRWREQGYWTNVLILYEFLASKGCLFSSYWCYSAIFLSVGEGLQSLTKTFPEGVIYLFVSYSW